MRLFFWRRTPKHLRGPNGAAKHALEIMQEQRRKNFRATHIQPELAKRIKCGPKAASFALSRLAAKGDVQRVKRGVYRLAA